MRKLEGRRFRLVWLFFTGYGFRGGNFVRFIVLEMRIVWEIDSI